MYPNCTSLCSLYKVRKGQRQFTYHLFLWITGIKNQQADVHLSVSNRYVKVGFRRLWHWKLGSEKFWICYCNYLCIDMIPETSKFKIVAWLDNAFVFPLTKYQEYIWDTYFRATLWLKDSHFLIIRKESLIF